MMKARCLGLLVILLSISACAPVHYQTTYRQAPVYATLGNAPSHHVKHSHARHNRYSPIQITLFAGTAYTGRGFQPVHVVIADGDYFEIPAQNRRGRSTRIFAHYSQGSLHFDANRDCLAIHGSSRYEYDRRWDNGYSYKNIRVGNDYDFTGLSLQIRNVSSSAQKNPHKPVKKASKPDKSYTKTTHEQTVGRLPVNNNTRQIKTQVKSQAPIRTPKNIQKVARQDLMNGHDDKPEKRTGLIGSERFKALRNKNNVALKGRPNAHETKAVQVVQRQQEDDRPEKVKARKNKHDRVAAAKQSDEVTDRKRVKASHSATGEPSATEEHSAGKSLSWIRDRNQPEKRKNSSPGESEH